MRHLKEYHSWENQIPLELGSKQEEWLDWVCSTDWQLGEDGKVNVLGDVDLAKGQGRGQGSTHLRVVDLGEGGTRQINFRGVKFGIVSGTFDCTRMMLQDLEGCPHTVGVDFLCGDNHMRNLKGGPRIVKGHYDTNDCLLETLEGGPEEVGGTFVLDHNILKDLRGLSPTLGGWLHINNNKLVSLEGLGKCRGITCYDNPVSPETLNLIFNLIQEKPGLPYGAVLIAIQSKIPHARDWERLDKGAIDRLSDKTRKGYKLLGGLGGI